MLKRRAKYSSLLGRAEQPTPLWNKAVVLPSEQAISISIDNSSIFLPGGSNPQNGFRRTEFIAANNGDHADLIPVIESGKTAFHVSIKEDEQRPLNFTHEYQIVFIEPNDGSHVFEIQLGMHHRLSLILRSRRTVHIRVYDFAQVHRSQTRQVNSRPRARTTSRSGTTR